MLSQWEVEIGRRTAHAVRQMLTIQPLVRSNTASSSCSPLLVYEESLQFCLIAGAELRLQCRHNRQNNEPLSSRSPADGRWLINTVWKARAAKVHGTHTQTLSAKVQHAATRRLTDVQKHILKYFNVKALWVVLVCDFTGTSTQHQRSPDTLHPLESNRNRQFSTIAVDECRPPKLKAVFHSLSVLGWWNL